MKINWRKILYRQLPDGSERIGFGVIAIITLVPLGLITWVTQGEKAARQKIASETVNLANVQRVVQEVEEVEYSPGTTINQDLVTEKVDGRMLTLGEAIQAQQMASTSNSPASEAPLSALDAAAIAALKEPDKERPIIDNDTPLAGDDEPFTPAVVGNGQSGSSGRNVGSISDGGAASQNIRNLTIYRRKKVETPAPQKEPEQKTEKFEPGTFLPRGHYIDLYLLDMVRTDTQQPIVTFAVARDVKFRGRVFLPFGTRVIASVGRAPEKGQRIDFDVTSFQFPDGTEIPVAGVIKGTDGASGVPAYYIPPPLWTEFSAYVADFIGGYLDLLQARQKRDLQLRIGNVDIGTGTDVFNPKLEALAATSEVIENFAQRQLDELLARNAPYLVAPIGSLARLQLTAPMSIKDRGVNDTPLPQPSGKQTLPFANAIPGVDLDTIVGTQEQLRQIQQMLAQQGMAR